MTRSMKKLSLAMAVIAWSVTAAFAQSFGISFGSLEVTADNAADIFGDGKAAYDLNSNTLVLQDGFDYHLSTGFVTIATGNDFTVRLEGNAEMAASVDCIDNVIVETEEPNALKITANISGSALKCPNLHIGRNVTLDLLSRNSADDKHALDCAGELSIDFGTLHAEVTTARLAVAVQRLTLSECYMQKPRGGIVNPVEGGICFGDGIAAKQVRLIASGTGIEENETPPTQRVQKVCENGQVVIIKDGKRYSLTGQAL